MPFDFHAEHNLGLDSSRKSKTTICSASERNMRGGTKAVVSQLTVIASPTEYSHLTWVNSCPFMLSGSDTLSDLPSTDIRLCMRHATPVERHVINNLRELP